MKVGLLRNSEPVIRTALEELVHCPTEAHASVSVKAIALPLRVAAVEGIPVSRRSEGLLAEVDFRTLTPRELVIAPEEERGVVVLDYVIDDRIDDGVRASAVRLLGAEPKKIPGVRGQMIERRVTPKTGAALAMRVLREAHRLADETTVQVMDLDAPAAPATEAAPASEPRDERRREFPWTTEAILSRVVQVGDRALHVSCVHLGGPDWTVLAIESRASHDLDAATVLDHALEAHAHQNLGCAPDMRAAMDLAENFAAAWPLAPLLQTCDCDTIIARDEHP